MHMMFVDESGDPGYPRNGKWAGWGGSVQYARVGVIIHGWKWKAWNERLLFFKRRNGLMWNDEIRASNIRRGKKAFSGWDKTRRDQFLIDLTTLIGQNKDITLLGIAIDKTKVKLSGSKRITQPEVRSLEFLLERYNLFLENQKDKSGIVILDPVEEKREDNLRRFQSYLLAKSLHLRPVHIVEGAFFAKSHTSNMIQIADICANVFYREMAYHSNHPEYQSIYKRFWRRNNRVMGYGIKRWP
jgi:hypothetical protein